MRKQIATITLTCAGLLTTGVVAGFFGNDEVMDSSQIQFIDGVAVVPFSNDTSGGQSNYDWKKHFDWQGCGVRDYRY